MYDCTWPCGRQVCAGDDHYVGPARNCPTPSLHVVVDYYEGYMVLVRHGDEEHPKPILLVKTFSSPNIVQLAQISITLRWNIAVEAPKIKMCSAHI